MKTLSPDAIIATYRKLANGRASHPIDRAALTDALNRADQLISAGSNEGDVCAYASATAYALAHMHRAFESDNRKTAFSALFQLLYMNGLLLDAREQEAADMMNGIASGAISEKALLAWVRSNSISRS